MVEGDGVLHGGEQLGIDVEHTILRRVSARLALPLGAIVWALVMAVDAAKLERALPVACAVVDAKEEVAEEL